MTGSLHLITAPARWPITLIQAKAQCRIDDTARDAEVDAFIEAVTNKYDGSEGLLGRALVEQTWEYRVPYLCTPISIPLPPTRSITSVKYLETDGVTETAISSSVYELVDQGFKRALLQPKYGQTWPSVTTADRPDAYRIRFVAGYVSVENNALSGTIPRGILNAMLLEVEQLFDGHKDYEKAITALVTPFMASWF